MRVDLVRRLKTLALPSLALVFVVAFVPGQTWLAARIYVLLVCGLALAYAVEALRLAFPPAAPLRALTTSSDVARRPATLSRLEQEVTLGIADAFDLHHRLRPRVRGLVQALLAVRRGVSLDGQPAAARRMLGEETWELVQSDRRPPQDRFARGMDPAELSRVVESLERL